MVVAVFVLCIALGSFAVSALSRIPNTLLPIALWVLLLLLGVLYEFADTAPYWAHALRNLYRDQSVGFYPFQIQAFLGMLLCLGLPVAISGAVLPLMFHALRETVTDLGDVAGQALQLEHDGLAARRVDRRLRAALLARSPPRLPDRDGGDRDRRAAHDAAQLRRRPDRARRSCSSRRSARSCCCRPGRPSGSRPGSSAIAPACRTPSTGRRPSSARYRQGKLVFYDDDPVASIAVKEFTGADGPGNLAIVSNGKSDGAIPGDYVTTGLLALVPALIARDPARVFVVGYGTGVTAGELTTLDETREVILAEISPAVIARGAALRLRQSRRVEEPEAEDRAGRRLPDAAAQRGQVRSDRVGAEQSVGRPASRCSTAASSSRRRATA